MKTILIYNHTRSIFNKDKWKPGIIKWFKNPVFIGCESGNFGAMIMVENYAEVKEKLPKTLKPVEYREEN